MKLMKLLRRLVSKFSKTFSFRLKPSVKTKKYLSKLRHKRYLEWIAFAKNYEIKSSFSKLLLAALDILITGAALYYAINNDSWLAYGLLAFMAQHYLKWFFKELKALKKTSSESSLQRQTANELLEDIRDRLKK